MENEDSSLFPVRPAYAETVRLAYGHWEARGRPIGSPEVDWSYAEQELQRRRQSTTAPSAKVEAASIKACRGTVELGSGITTDGRSNVREDSGENGRQKIQGVFAWSLFFLFCYRYARQVKPSGLSIPPYAADVSAERIRTKAQASIGSAGVFFAFAIAVLAALVGSDGIRAELKKSWNTLLIANVWSRGVLFWVLGFVLPCAVIWLERLTTYLNVIGSPKKYRVLGNISRIIVFIGTCIFFLHPTFLFLPAQSTDDIFAFQRVLLFSGFTLLIPTFLFLPAQSTDDIFAFQRVLPFSGFTLLIFSVFCLLLSIELYDSALGWRGEGRRAYLFHLASIASHFYLVGFALALIGLSLLLCLLEIWQVRVIPLISLAAVITITGLERRLWVRGGTRMRLLNALKRRKCVSRSLKRLAEIGRVSESQVSGLLREVPDVVFNDSGTVKLKVRTPEFWNWKNHAATVMPGEIDSMPLGSKSYTRGELRTILGKPRGDDTSLILAQSLIAAKLNIKNGSNPTPVKATIQHADNLLNGFAGKLPYNVSPSSHAGQAMINAATILGRYNNGDG